jgi:hypothetical protein
MNIPGVHMVYATERPTTGLHTMERAIRFLRNGRSDDLLRFAQADQTYCILSRPPTHLRGARVSG